jgi:hypothetical protein
MVRASYFLMEPPWEGVLTMQIADLMDGLSSTASVGRLGLHHRLLQLLATSWRSRATSVPFISSLRLYSFLRGPL